MTLKPPAQLLAHRNRELAILNEIASSLNQEVDLDAALKTALAKVADLLGLRTGWIWLLSGEKAGEPYLAAAQNLPPALRNEPQRMEGDCYCLSTFRSGDLSGAANINVVSCSRLSGLVDGTGGLLTHTSVPLYASHGTRLGVLNVAGSQWRELSPEELQLLHTIGDLLSITIERARLFARSAQIGAAEERNRLAREIHDTLAQNLAAITLQMETADALIEAGAGQEAIAATVRKALALSRSGLDEARRSVLDLRAAPLEGRTLAPAMERLVQDFQGRTGIAVRFDLVGAHAPLPHRIEVSIYRITQEALANVQQHAAAKQVDIKLIVTPDSLQLSIQDDGRGFQPQAIPEGHYGLIGINERVHLMGGKLDLQSAPGAGTQLAISIPLEASS
ncbi:MAG: GAF domain-containing protein [Chloroflexi bacterium]|jgi:two-component system NarL family sensor kinase|nr:GAF domain-containing protein [Chloroflexota bacterium]